MRRSWFRSVTVFGPTVALATSSDVFRRLFEAHYQPGQKNDCVCLLCAPRCVLIARFLLPARGDALQDRPLAVRHSSRAPLKIVMPRWFAVHRGLAVTATLAVIAGTVVILAGKQSTRPQDREPCRVTDACTCAPLPPDNSWALRDDPHTYIGLAVLGLTLVQGAPRGLPPVSRNGRSCWLVSFSLTFVNGGALQRPLALSRTGRGSRARRPSGGRTRRTGGSDAASRSSPSSTASSVCRSQSAHGRSCPQRQQRSCRPGWASRSRPRPSSSTSTVSKRYIIRGDSTRAPNRPDVGPATKVLMHVVRSCRFRRRKPSRCWSTARRRTARPCSQPRPCCTWLCPLLSP
jgi:hypothetical protein